MRHLASFITAVLQAAIAAGALLLPLCQVRAAGLQVSQPSKLAVCIPLINSLVFTTGTAGAQWHKYRQDRWSVVSRQLGGLLVVPADSVARQGMVCVCLALQHAARSGVTCL